MKKLKKYISILLAVLMISSSMPLTALADDKVDMSGSDEEVSWSYTASTDTLYINGENLFLLDDGALPTYKDDVYVQVEFSHLVIGKDVTTLEYKENCFSANVQSSYVYEQSFDLTFEEGIQLKAIGQDAFEYSTVTSVVFPDSIEVIGEFSFDKCYNLENIVLPANLKRIERYAFYGCPITKLELPNNLKYISDSSFYETDIKELTLPDSVTSIGSSAFAYCRSLEKINFSKNAENLVLSFDAFKCTAIKELTIPSYVSKIYSWAFAGCSSLSSVEFEIKETEDGLQGITELYSSIFSGTNITTLTLPETVTTLRNAFLGMKQLVSVDLSKTKITKLYDKMFSGDSNLTEVKFPSGLTEIGSYVFNQCTSLKSIEIPETVTTMSSDGYQFNECTNLEYVKLPESITSIPMYIFYKCSNLKKVNISSKTTQINDSAFCLCKSLIDINIPDTVTKICSNAFNTCAADFDLPASLTYVGNYAFNKSGLTKAVFKSKVDIKNYGFYNSDNLTQVVLPQTYGSAAINNYAFYGCDNLESVYISANIEEIGYYSFQKCESLTNVQFADGSKLATIDKYAFEGCKALTKIFLPKTVKVIDEYGFYNCTSLKTINLEDTQLTSIYHYTFANTGLEHVEFPNTLTGFRSGAFYQSKLASLELSEKVGAVSKGSFSGCPITKVTVYNPNINFNDSTFSGTDTTIRGYKDSTAESFAEENGMTFIPLDAGEIEDSSLPKHGIFDGGTWIITDENELVVNADGAIKTNSAYDSNGWKYSFAQLADINGVTSVVVGDGVTSLPNNFLYDSKFSTQDISTVSLPDTLESIGSSAFKFTYLSYIDIPDSVTAIGDYAFYEAGLSGGVKLSKSLTKINQYAFANNDFASVTIPSSVTEIALGAFNNCTNLMNVSIPDSVKTINEGSSTTKPLGFDSSGDRIDGFTIKCKLDSRAYQYAIKNGLNTKLDMRSGYITGYYSSRSCAKWYYYPDTKEFYFVSNNVIPSNNTFYYSNGTAITDGELEVDKLYVCYGVTDFSAINNECIFKVLNPKYILLPDSLTSISDNAFSGLTNLKSVTIPDTVATLSATSFNNCNIEAISFGDGLKAIPDYLFKDNKALKYIDFGNVGTIGTGSFQSCTALEEIVIPSNLTAIGENAFAKCLSVKSVTIEYGKDLTIGDKAFADLPLCDTVKFNRADVQYTTEACESIFRNLGSGTTGVCLSVGDENDTQVHSTDFSLFNKKNIVDLNIGESITEIKNSVSLPYLKNISVDKNNETFFSYGGCLYSYSSNNISLIMAPTNLEEVEIYEGTRWIKQYVFCGGKIKHIEIPEGVTIIGEGAFKDCTELRKITLPTTLQTISYYAFQNCTKLKIVDIPSAMFILNSAFKNCTSLASILLPDNLHDIDSEAFAGCTSLTGIVMPNNDSCLDPCAFENCTSLTEVYMWDNDFQEDTFKGCDNVVIHTLVGSDSYTCAKEYGLNLVTYTDENVFADQCAMMEDIYEGYIGFCDDGHGDIQYLTVYEPTCEQDGYIIGVCEYCSVILEEIHIEATGHKYEKAVTIDPTETTVGVEKYTCTACGDSYCVYSPALGGDTAEKTLCNITGKTVIANSKYADTGVTPLKSVSVKLGDETLATTDSNGNFSFSLETGVYELTLWYNYGFERTVYLVVEDKDVNIGSVPMIACDWNKDGKIDDGDMELFKFVISSKEGDPAYLDYVDMNNDGKIDVKDLVYMNYVKGLNKETFTYPSIVAEAKF